MQCSQQAAGVTVSTGLAFNPCASPAEIVVTIEAMGQSWTHTITAGHSGTLPIPGIFWSVGVASVGAVLEFALSGNAGSLDVTLDIDACGMVLLQETCLSDTMSAVFPIRLLDTTLHFGACPPTTAAPTSPPNMPGIVQISTASQHCHRDSRMSTERGHDDREDCYQACRAVGAG